MKNRDTFKKWLHAPPADHGAIDDLDRKALSGYEYLEKEDDFDASLNRLDQRFGALIEKETPKPQPKGVVRPLHHRRWLGVAAAVLLLVVPMFYLLNMPVSNTALFAQHFEAPRSTYLLTSRGDAAQDNQDLTNAFALYEKGDYQQALPAIKDLANTYPERKDLTYYAGISALAAGDTEEAIKLLELAQQSDYQEIDEKSRYFLGLAHLKLGETVKARQWLSAAESGVYGDKAKKLSKELD